MSLVPGAIPVLPPPPVKCLLVDDLAENLLALSALLQEDGVELLQARSGAEALELLLAHDVALALVDVQMPEMDGFELAELMRGSERTRHVPIIFVTAGDHDQHRVFRGYDSGAVDFLHKPIEPRILRNKAAVFFQLWRQRRQLAEDLRVRTETLRLNEMFLAVLGHDLRTPLSAIVMSATVMRMRAPDEPGKQAAARILSSGKRMSRMIGDLFDLTRVRLAGGMPIHRTEADLSAIVERIVQEQRTAMPDRAIVWQQSGDCCGSFDPDRIAQVTTNLVGNALTHGEAGSPVQVRLDGAAAGSVRLQVSNRGSIAAELLPHIFDPFRSGRPHGGDGLGIGLFIVQQIVEAHGGRIEVQSGRDGETAFNVELPRAAPPGLPSLGLLEGA